MSGSGCPTAAVAGRSPPLAGPQADGIYNVGGSAVGSYRVGFGDISGRYLGQYYNAKATIDAADPVALVATAGETISSIRRHAARRNTPAGDNVAVEVDAMGLLGPVEFTYSTVTVAGITSVTTSFSDPGWAMFRGRRFDVLAHRNHCHLRHQRRQVDHGGAAVRSPRGSPSSRNNLSMHFDSGAWVDVTTSVDTTAHEVYGRVKHLSWFAVGVDTRPPTTTASGADALWHNAQVTLTLSPSDAAGGSGMSGARDDP